MGIAPYETTTEKPCVESGHWAASQREAGRGADSHTSDIGHWLGMTPLRGVRGDAPQGYLLRCVGIAPYEKTRGCGRKTGRTESSAPTMGTQYITS